MDLTIWIIVIKIIKFQGAPGDISQLHRALMSRISLSKRNSLSAKEDENSQRSAERLEAATDENDYLETEKSVDDSNQEDEDTQASDETANRQTIDVNRLESSEDKTDDATCVDEHVEKETKALKRKEPVQDETSPKRQCQEV